MLLQAQVPCWIFSKEFGEQMLSPVERREEHLYSSNGKIFFAQWTLLFNVV